MARGGSGPSRLAAPGGAQVWSSHCAALDGVRSGISSLASLDDAYLIHHVPKRHWKLTSYKLILFLSCLLGLEGRKCERKDPEGNRSWGLPAPSRWGLFGFHLTTVAFLWPSCNTSGVCELVEGEVASGLDAHQHCLWSRGPGPVARAPFVPYQGNKPEVATTSQPGETGLGTRCGWVPVMSPPWGGGWGDKLFWKKYTGKGSSDVLNMIQQISCREPLSFHPIGSVAENLCLFIR